MSPQPVSADHWSAWIATDGRFFPVQDCGHSVAAIEIVADLGLEDVAGSWPGDYLQKTLGWVHLSFATVYIDLELTQAQIDTLFDLLSAYRANARDSRAADLERSLHMHLPREY